MKKAIKITAIALGSLIIIILLLPFVFKGKIEKAVQSEINKSLNAKVAFDGVGLSLLRHFPNLTVKVKKLTVVGTGNFANDTLASIPALSLTLDLASVIHGSDYKVKQIALTSPRILFKVLKDGKANWDVMKETAKTDTVSKPSAFKVTLDKINITDAFIVYNDATLPMMLEVNGMTASLHGDMTADITTLDLSTTIKELTADYAGVRYMNKANADLATTLSANLTTWTFTFKDAAMRLNELKLAADGSFAMPKVGYQMDIKFAAKENTFKAFLSLIPAIYSKDFSSLKTSGTLAFDGFVRGLYSDNSMPTFAINLKVADGMFSYPSLPGNVSDVNLQAAIANPDGVMDHTTIDVTRFHINMMQNPFDATLSVRTPVSDADVNASIKGSINLANISKIYPLADKTKLAGTINAEMAFNGKVSAIEKGAYDQFKASGFLTLDKFLYAGSSLPQEISINKARLDITPANLTLSDLTMLIGKNDLTLNGKLENYIPYIMKKATVLKGSFTATSKMMDLNSLMAKASTASAKADTSALTVVAIPANMEFALNSTFGRLIYDTYDLSNVSGTIRVKDQSLIMEGLQASMLGGSVTMNGSYSTINPTPLVDMNMAVKNLDVKQTYQAFGTVQKFAPIAAKLKGAISTNLKFKGALKKNMMPDMTSISANGLILSDLLGLTNLNTFGRIADVLKMDKLRNPSLEKVNLSFDVADGKATVKPMDFKLGSYKANFGGTTGLDQVLNFVLTLDIPRSEFGASANGVLNGLMKDASAKGVNVNLGDIIPVTILIGGTATDPKITTGIKSAMAGLAEDMKKQALQQVEKKKEELVNKAKDEAASLIAKADAEAAKLIAEAEKQSQKILQAGTFSANKIRSAADSTANRLTAEGKKNGYIAEIAAKKGAEKIKKEGDAKAQKAIQEAQKQSDALIQKAKSEADKLKQEAIKKQQSIGDKK